MKNFIKYIFFLMLILIGCMNTKEEIEIINYNSSDTLINKDIIIDEINKSLNLLDSGITYMDSDLIFAIFSENKNALYVREGYIYDDWDDARKEYDKWFSSDEAKNMERDFVFKSKKYEILSPNSVLFTGLGSIYTLPNTQESWDIAYTILWIKTNKGWQASNMHISWK